MQCPKCGFEQLDASAQECEKCGQESGFVPEYHTTTTYDLLRTLRGTLSKAKVMTRHPSHQS